jgi:hypothetical protein
MNKEWFFLNKETLSTKLTWLYNKIKDKNKITEEVEKNFYEISKLNFNEDSSKKIKDLLYILSDSLIINIEKEINFPDFFDTSEIKNETLLNKIYETLENNILNNKKIDENFKTYIDNLLEKKIELKKEDEKKINTILEEIEKIKNTEETEIKKERAIESCKRKIIDISDKYNKDQSKKKKEQTIASKIFSLKPLEIKTPFEYEKIRTTSNQDLKSKDISSNIKKSILAIEGNKEKIFKKINEYIFSLSKSCSTIYSIENINKLLISIIDLNESINFIKKDTTIENKEKGQFLKKINESLITKEKDLDFFISSLIKGDIVKNIKLEIYEIDYKPEIPDYIDLLESYKERKKLYNENLKNYNEEEKPLINKKIEELEKETGIELEDVTGIVKYEEVIEISDKIISETFNDNLFKIIEKETNKTLIEKNLKEELKKNIISILTTNVPAEQEIESIIKVINSVSQIFDKEYSNIEFENKMLEVIIRKNNYEKTISDRKEYSPKKYEFLKETADLKLEESIISIENYVNEIFNSKITNEQEIKPTRLESNFKLPTQNYFEEKYNLFIEETKEEKSINPVNKIKLLMIQRNETIKLYENNENIIDDGKNLINEVINIGETIIDLIEDEDNEKAKELNREINSSQFLYLFIKEKKHPSGRDTNEILSEISETLISSEAFDKDDMYNKENYYYSKEYEDLMSIVTNVLIDDENENENIKYDKIKNLINDILNGNITYTENEYKNKIKDSEKETPIIEEIIKDNIEESEVGKIYDNYGNNDGIEIGNDGIEIGINDNYWDNDGINRNDGIEIGINDNYWDNDGINRNDGIEIGSDDNYWGNDGINRNDGIYDNYGNIDGNDEIEIGSDGIDDNYWGNDGINRNDDNYWDNKKPKDTLEGIPGF